jgi:hypothetical protein
MVGELKFLMVVVVVVDVEGTTGKAKPSKNISGTGVAEYFTLRE